MFNHDEFDLGSAPAAEDCVQVSRTEPYIDAMTAECYRYKAMLEKRFPDFDTFACRFRVKMNPHDFGPYYDVAIRFPVYNEAAVEFACFVDENLPARWDEEDVLRFTVQSVEGGGND